MKRLKFKKGKQREYLLKVKNEGGLSANQLSEIVGISRRSYCDWEHEKSSMTVNAANKFMQMTQIGLPEHKNVLAKRWVDSKISACKKGGLSRFVQHGSPGTLVGRRKGGKKSLENMRKKGIVPLPKTFRLPSQLSSELAEFVGILLGDGCITRRQVQISLNKKADRLYVPHVADLSHKLFGRKPNLIHRENYNVSIIYYSGVNLVNYLLSIGMQVGSKVKQQVGVPDWIKSSEEYDKSCLRGLVDTDGGIFLHKYKVNSKNYVYKKLSFTNRSIPLIDFVRATLKKYGLNPKVTKMESKRVWLYNSSEVEKYLKIVGSNNPRLLTRRSARVV